MNGSRGDAETRSGEQLNIISGEIVDAAFHIHQSLGPGLLESVYETVLAHELTKRGLRVERQKMIPVEWDGLTIDNGFRADLIVEACVAVELKSVESLAPVHGKQLLTYLRLLDYRLGLLLNFGAPIMKEGIKRVVNDFSAPPRLCVSQTGTAKEGGL